MRENRERVRKAVSIEQFLPRHIHTSESPYMFLTIQQTIHLLHKVKLVEHVNVNIGMLLLYLLISSFSSCTEKNVLAIDKS